MMRYNAEPKLRVAEERYFTPHTNATPEDNAVQPQVRQTADPLPSLLTRSMPNIELAVARSTRWELRLAPVLDRRQSTTRQRTIPACQRARGWQELRDQQTAPYRQESFTLLPNFCPEKGENCLNPVTEDGDFPKIKGKNTFLFPKGNQHCYTIVTYSLVTFVAAYGFPTLVGYHSSKKFAFCVHFCAVADDQVVVRQPNAIPRMGDCGQSSCLSALDL